MLLERRTPWPSQIEEPPPRRPELDDANAVLTFIGHATFLIQTAAGNILTDPVWSTSLGPGITRNVRPGIILEEANPAVVLVSHNHRDHLDAPTIRRLGARPTYVVPAGLGPFFTSKGADKVKDALRKD
jgi:L-ascorbate metabolism protein UlaG (beta-lactamase superfamily)